MLSLRSIAVVSEASHGPGVLHRTRKQQSKLFEIGLIAALVLAVAIFGGTETISWDVLQAILLLLGAGLLTQRPLHFGRENAGEWLVPAALVAVLGIQWWLAHEGLLPRDPAASRTEWIRLAVYFCAFHLAREIARTPAPRKRLCIALVLLGVFEALYGFVQYLTGWQYIFTYAKRFYLEDATGTYINHNHFSGFLEMVLPLAVGLAAANLDSTWLRNRPHSLAAWLSGSELHKPLLLVFVAALLFLAIVSSRSRMGLISCCVSLVVMTAILLRRRGRTFVAAALMMVLFAAGAALAFWIGLEPVISRFEALPSQEPLGIARMGRLAVWEDTVRLIRQHRWFGVGLGCFEVAYTAVQSVNLTSVVDHAHNDYLELTVELGLVGAGVLFGVIFWIAARTLRAALVGPLIAGRNLALGVLGGIFALLLHSLADFNLYLPANGLVFAVLLGLGSALGAEDSLGRSRPFAG